MKLKNPPRGWRIVLVRVPGPTEWAERAGEGPFYGLFDKVVDVQLANFKFGSAACALRMADAEDCCETAEAGPGLIGAQGARVIVKMLVLPGHVECCHKPVLEKLRAHRTGATSAFKASSANCPAPNGRNLGRKRHSAGTCFRASR